MSWINKRLTVTWLCLILATLVSVELPQQGVAPAYAVVIVIAFVKARYIGLDFMDLRHGPVWLRCLFEGWIGVVGSAIIAMRFLWGAGA